MNGGRLPELRGVVPVVVTPFAEDGSLDVGQFERQIEFLLTGGVRWVGLGYGSEAPRLRQDELSDLISRIVTHGSGRLHVVGNAEVGSVETGLEAVSRVADAGGDMAMVRLSGMAGLPEPAVADVLVDLASREVLPLVVQDAPQSTGVGLSASVLAQLLRDVPQVAAVKVESDNPALKIADVVRDLRGEQGVVLGGKGGLYFVDELRGGAAGTMPGPAFHEVFDVIWNRHETGDAHGAASVWARVLPLLMLFGGELDTFLVVQKYLLMRRGVLDRHALRPPHAALDPDLIAHVDTIVDQIGLWDLLTECGGSVQGG